MNPSKSYASPRARCSIIWFSSASMSRTCASCSGDMFCMPCAMPRKYAPSTCSRTCSSSSSNIRCASGIHEPVVRQLAELTGRVGGEVVQERLAHPRVVLGLERQRAPFAVQDLLELLPDLLQGTAEVERLLLLLAHLAEAAAEGVHPREPALHAAAHQTAEGVVGAGAHQDVVGQLLQHVGRVDRGVERFLGAVPARVAVAHPFSLRGAAPTEGATPRWHGSRTVRRSRRSRRSDARSDARAPRPPGRS